jgi:hypothetical protein
VVGVIAAMYYGGAVDSVAAYAALQALTVLCGHAWVSLEVAIRSVLLACL